MPLNPDFRDLFSAFNAANVRYLVVGGYAVMHHTQPRYTKDLDVWVEPTPENARRALAALAEFGAPLGQITIADLTNPDTVVQIGLAPNRIDILTEISGVEFAPAWERADGLDYGDAPIRILAIEDAIAAKRASGRPQDLADLDALERARAWREKTQPPST